MCTRLGRQYATAVVTGRIRKDAVTLLKLAEVHVHDLVAFGDYRRPKPDPEPLLMACRHLGVSPEHAVYVGDAPSDCVAARGAGTYCIRVSDVQDSDADITINDMNELESAVEAIARL